LPTGFRGAIYPGYLIEQQLAGVEINQDTLAPYIRIPKETPPIFLVHASDDSVASAENSVVMYLALKKASVPAELHVYAHGRHGSASERVHCPVQHGPIALSPGCKTKGCSGRTFRQNEPAVRSRIFTKWALV
jgi:acetyl esterase/lipase